MRPFRIGADEIGVTLEAGAGVVAAQDDPFGKLAGDRVVNRLFRRVGIVVLALARSLDHGFQRREIGRGGAGGGGDGEGSRDRPRQRLDVGGNRGAAQADGGLGIGRHGAPSRLRAFARQRHGPQRGRLGNDVQRRARARKRRVLGDREGRRNAEQAGKRACQHPAHPFRCRYVHAAPYGVPGGARIKSGHMPSLLRRTSLRKATSRSAPSIGMQGAKARQPGSIHPQG